VSPEAALASVDKKRAQPHHFHNRAQHDYVGLAQGAADVKQAVTLKERVAALEASMAALKSKFSMLENQSLGKGEARAEKKESRLGMTLNIEHKSARCSETNALDIVSYSQHGTALIVGANIGAVPNDPSWKALASPTFNHIDKVYVEPHPGLFKQLTKNVKSMPRARAIRAAVTDAAGPMKIYCLGLDENGDETPEARTTPGFQMFWSQICSGSRDRLMSKYDVKKNRRINVNLSALVVEVNVPTMTAPELLEVAPSSVQYLQIDVEGFDDQVLSQFFVSDRPSFVSFRPLAIVFEYVLLGKQRTDAAISLLNKHAYTTCFKGQNVIGILDARV